MTDLRLLRHIAACNKVDPSRFRPFHIGSRAIGAIGLPQMALLLSRSLAQPEGAGAGVPDHGFADLTARLAEILETLSKAGLMGRLRGETFAVVERWGDAPMAKIDRAGLPALGLPAFGVHVNGYVRRADGLYLWIGRRASDRLAEPGKLDHLVAGGLSFGHDAWSTLIKEAGEEAGLPPEIAARARPVGLVSYRLGLAEGQRNDTLFVYDLELPEAVVPVSVDGEVAGFELWPAAEVLTRIRDSDDFKFNVNLVLIDFMMRHGLLDPDRDTDYCALADGLRRQARLLSPATER